MASGFDRSASLSPGFLSEALHCSASRDFLSDTTASLIVTGNIGSRNLPEVLSPVLPRSLHSLFPFGRFAVGPKFSLG